MILTRWHKAAASTNSSWRSTLSGVLRSFPSHFKLRSRCGPFPLLILALAIIPVATVHAEQWKKLNPQGYVNDFAGVVNATTVEKLTAVSMEVDQKAKAQSVVTIRHWKMTQRRTLPIIFFRSGEWGPRARIVA